MQRQTFDIGQPIPLPDESPAALYLFTSGPVEFVTSNGFFGKHKVRLDQGEYLSLPDVHNFNSDVLGLRSATDDTVEALVLNQAAFQDWMAEDHDQLSDLSNSADERLSSWRAHGRTYR